MEMAGISRSMELPGKRKSPPETTLNGSVSGAPNKQYRPWLQQKSPASNGILHIPTNMLSPQTLQSLMQGKRTTQMEPAVQKPGKPVVNKRQHIPPRGSERQHIPPRGSVKRMDEANESMRSKVRDSLADALALVHKQDELPKGKENLETRETLPMNFENTQSFQPASHEASITVPAADGTLSDLPTSVESSVQKDGEISIDIKTEDMNQSDGGLKSQYDEVFPRDNIPFPDIIFPNDDLLQGNELSWVLEHVSDLEETKEYGPSVEKSFQDPQLLASKIELELFKLFGGVNKKYKERVRSLLFNLKDMKNPELRERVMSGDISAERLCSMTAEELASKELSQWRQAKAEQMAKMVVLQDTDVDVRSLVRKTHKGEFQVEIDPVDSGTVDVSAGIMSHSRRRPRAKSDSAKTILKVKTEQSDQETSRATPPSNEEIDLMQGLALDDELKDVEFLPPIVSLDEFMESLDSEPPFESPHGNSEMQVSLSEKSDSEVGSHSKSPKESPKKPIEEGSAKPQPVKIDEVSPKSDVSVKLEDGVSKLEQTSSLSDVKGERVWDGILQLSMSMSSVVPVTGIFKSGEKAETSEWPVMMEVKGRVRMSGFRKFIQELPKSRTRVLMVMYLACKDGISESQRGSLIEVIDSYVADERVGYAEPASGVEVYLCPTRGESLDLLSKVVSEDQFDEIKTLESGLIGVVVFRRATVHKPALKRHHSSLSSSSRASVLSENKKQRMNVAEKPRVASMGNHHHYGYGSKAVEDNDDDLPPGFGPVGSREDDDLPEFNFNSSVAPVSSPRSLPPQSKSLDQVRKLIHMYGNSANNYDNDDDDDIPEWRPDVPSHQLPPPTPPPGFRPDMGVQDHMLRPPQDGWWDNQNGGSGQHYDQNRSRNRGF